MLILYSMPSRNSVKVFEPDQMWHVYNRGIDNRNIFNSEKDYAVFLSYLKVALSKEKPDETSLSNIQEIIRLRRLHLYEDVELISYCLMPNHFHLLIYQYSEDGISRLMRSLATGYVMYFNRIYKRSGRLFQGTYKAALINSEPYWWHISRYIHLNPLDINKDYKRYPYSSYQYYKGEKHAEWLQPRKILDGFKSIIEYEEFVADYEQYKLMLDDIKKLVADY